MKSPWIAIFFVATTFGSILGSLIIGQVLPPGDLKSCLITSMILIPIGILSIYSGWDFGHRTTGDSFVVIDRKDHPRTFAFYNKSMIAIGSVLIGAAALVWIKWLI